MSLWYTENFKDRFSLGLKVSRHLHSEQSEFQRIEILEGRAGVNPNLLDTLVGVIDVAAAATFETVGPWVALRSGLNRWFHRFGGFDRLDGLLFVAHRCVAGPIDSIDDNSRR